MQKTDIILSIAGRDAGKYLVAVDADDQYVYLCDGKGRGILNPKKKKKKHCQYQGKCDEGLASKLMSEQKVSNSDIRKSISQFVEREKHQSGTADDTLIRG